MGNKALCKNRAHLLLLLFQLSLARHSEALRPQRYVSQVRHVWPFVLWRHWHIHVCRQGCLPCRWASVSGVEISTCADCSAFADTCESVLVLADFGKREKELPVLDGKTLTPTLLHWLLGGMAITPQTRLAAWKPRNRSRSSRKRCLRRLRRRKRKSTASSLRGRSAQARGGMCGRRGIRGRQQKWRGRQTSSCLLAHRGKGRGRIQEAQVKVTRVWAAALDIPRAVSLHCFHTVHAHLR